MSIKRYLCRRDLAELYGVHVNTIIRWQGNGTFPLRCESVASAMGPGSDLVPRIGANRPSCFTIKDLKMERSETDRLAQARGRIERLRNRRSVTYF